MGNFSVPPDSRFVIESGISFAEVRKGARTRCKGLP
jgi:hypothetical protein